MTILTYLGIASVIFVAAHTWWAAVKAKHTSGQSPRASIVEAWANILIGFSINFSMNLVMLPLMTDGGHLTLARNFWGGWVFTVVSIVRQYTIRRWFNNRIHLFAARAAEKMS